MLSSRTLSSAILILLLFLSLFPWNWMVSILFSLYFVYLLVVVGVLELVVMLRKMGLAPHWLLLGFLMSASFLASLLSGMRHFLALAPGLPAFAFEVSLLLVLIGVSAVSAMLALIFTGSSRARVGSVVGAYLAQMFYILPLTSMLLVYYGFSHEYGRAWVLFLVAASKAADIGAYCVGTLSARLMPNGNHKVFPGISPKKSFEGLVGGLAASIVAAYLVYVWSALPELVPLWKASCLALLFFVGSVAGDLMESALKRAAGVKDSGGFIPGIGGVLDLADSIILNAVLLTVYLGAQTLWSLR